MDTVTGRLGQSRFRHYDWLRADLGQSHPLTLGATGRFSFLAASIANSGSHTSRLTHLRDMAGMVGPCVWSLSSRGECSLIGYNSPMSDSRGKANPCPNCGESRVSIEAKCGKCGWLPEQRPSNQDTRTTQSETKHPRRSFGQTDGERRYVPPNTSTSVATILSFMLSLFVVAFVALPFIDESILEGAEWMLWGIGGMLCIVPLAICVSVVLACIGHDRANTPFATTVLVIAIVSLLAVVVMFCSLYEPAPFNGALPTNR